MFFRRTQVLPLEKTWHIRFYGHIDDLLALEEGLYITLAIYNPVVLDRAEEDELDLWLDWEEGCAEQLATIVLTDVTLGLNERVEEGKPC